MTQLDTMSDPGHPTPTQLSVECDDGQMGLSVWRPDTPPVGSVLLLQEIFGVGEYVHAVAQRLVALGVVVGAPDVFWRIHPGWTATHDEHGMRASMGVAGKLDFPQAITDCVTALNYLGAIDEVDGEPSVLGFCMGGTLAFGVAAEGHPARCVSYYGSGVPDMLDLLPQITCPLLLHFGSKDPYIAQKKVAAIGDAIAGRADTLLNVEIAGHAFDNEKSEMFYAEAAAKAAWAKTVAFLSPAWTG